VRRPKRRKPGETRRKKTPAEAGGGRLPVKHSRRLGVGTGLVYESHLGSIGRALMIVNCVGMSTSVYGSVTRRANERNPAEAGLGVPNHASSYAERQK
jgi:hypothetical protein